MKNSWLGLNKLKRIFNKTDNESGEVCSNVQIDPINENEHGENEEFFIKAETEKPINSRVRFSEPLDKFKVVKDTLEYNGTAFTVKSANQWIKEAADKPVPQMILGELWFEGEICIMFADTNVGKSILAVQIANSITKGEEIKPFTLEIKKKKVLYFDFELTDRQFTNRYSEQQDGKYKNFYNFDDDFLRVEINKDTPLSNGYKSYEEYLIKNIEDEIANFGVETIIIDNLSCIISDNQDAKNAAPFMQQLKAVKDKHNVSILVLAHTPKRDNSRPLDVNDLAGSKMLSNYADSIFAIGKSQTDTNFRYLKQIKVRNTEMVYDSENVCVFEINKADNFLKFDFKWFDNEFNHLEPTTRKSKETQKEEAKKLKSQGKTQREISKTLGISLGKTNTLLNEDVQFYDTNKMNKLNEGEQIHIVE
jgi:RecA-family ATPase